MKFVCGNISSFRGTFATSILAYIKIEDKIPLIQLSIYMMRRRVLNSSDIVEELAIIHILQLVLSNFRENCLKASINCALDCLVSTHKWPLHPDDDAGSTLESAGYIYLEDPACYKRRRACSQYTSALCFLSATGCTPRNASQYVSNLHVILFR